jgi:hypothetical protein
VRKEIAEALPVPRGADARVAELAVVVPTFNERDNVSEVVSRLEDCLRG